jgi:predicted nucleic acid-binding protein
MSKFLADTSLIIDLINNRNGRREFIRQLLKPGDTLNCCTINVIEVYTGMQPGEEAITAIWFERLLYRDVTRKLRNGLALSAIIGASAERHFRWRMPRLRLWLSITAQSY